MDSLHPEGFAIEPARPEEVGLVLSFIREIADYEKLAAAVVTDEATLRESLFGQHPAAEAVIGRHRGKPVGFAVFCHNFSTFLGRRGMYLEDLFVRPAERGKGFGLALFRHVAHLAAVRGCGRMEWSVLDWNEPAIRFYRALGAEGMDGWTVFRLAGEALQKAGEAGSATRLP
jgi:GNAT superfamily N-acetyltransferase